MSIFKTIINKVKSYKDKGLSTLAKSYINTIIQEYGDLVDLKIDSVQKDIILDVLLKGEKSNIRIVINKYEIIRQDYTSFIKFGNITASREWINRLLHNIAIPNYFPKHKIEIDPSYAKIIDLLI